MPENSSMSDILWADKLRKEPSKVLTCLCWYMQRTSSLSEDGRRVSMPLKKTVRHGIGRCTYVIS